MSDDVNQNNDALKNTVLATLNREFNANKKQFLAERRKKDAIAKAEERTATLAEPVLQFLSVLEGLHPGTSGKSFSVTEEFIPEITRTCEDIAKDRPFRAEFVSNPADIICGYPHSFTPFREISRTFPYHAREITVKLHNKTGEDDSIKVTVYSPTVHKNLTRALYYKSDDVAKYKKYAGTYRFSETPDFRSPHPQNEGDLQNILVNVISWASKVAPELSEQLKNKIDNGAFDFDTLTAKKQTRKRKQVALKN